MPNKSRFETHCIISQQCFGRIVDLRRRIRNQRRCRPNQRIISFIIGVLTVIRFFRSSFFCFIHSASHLLHRCFLILFAQCGQAVIYTGQTQTESFYTLGLAIILFCILLFLRSIFLLRFFLFRRRILLLGFSAVLFFFGAAAFRQRVKSDRHTLPPLRVHIVLQCR